MLLTKTIKMKWADKNKNYYINKGYIFTGKNEDFEIKVEDLLNGSHVKVEVKCDCPDCKNPYLKPMEWRNYKKNIKVNNKYYCQKCMVKLYGHEKMIKTKLENSISFHQWCCNNLSQQESDNILNRWDYELNIDKNKNIIKPNDVSYGSKVKYWFKCPRGIHKSELKSIQDFTSNENKLCCLKCNSFGQFLLDNFGENAIELYWSSKNIINPFEISRGSKNIRVYIKCQTKDYHDEYSVTPSSFISGHRCPHCSKNSGKVHLLDSLGVYIIEKYGNNYLDKIWSEKNKDLPIKYSPKNDKEVYWKCENGKHKDYKRKISDSNTCDFRCPECVRERDESFLQEKVRLYLNELGYTVLHENKCTIVPKNPKVKGTNNTMPYDNEVVELKLLIEIQGIQHYKITNFHNLSANKNNTTPEYELHMQQVRDRYKRVYAKYMKYSYLEIPYWTDDKNEQWKKLIDNKIKEIKSKELRECI